jgi:hypothetical protein
MNLDEDKLYIKIISLDAIYNFIVEKFLILNCLESKNIILSSRILKFKISKFFIWSFPVSQIFFLNPHSLRFKYFVWRHIKVIVLNKI